jgi:hypothetical protein
LRDRAAVGRALERRAGHWKNGAGTAFDRAPLTEFLDAHGKAHAATAAMHVDMVVVHTRALARTEPDAIDNDSSMNQSGGTTRSAIFAMWQEGLCFKKCAARSVLAGPVTLQV